MRIITNEQIVYVDIDGTLLLWKNVEENGENKVSLPYGDRTIYLTPHVPNIDLVKEYKNRGYFIIFHSANGHRHATNAVTALNLTSCADLIMSKSIKYVDDKPSEDWIGSRVFLPEDFYDNSNAS